MSRTRNLDRRVLHLGPFQPALEAALAREVSAVRSFDPMMPIVVLCPTPLLCTHLKRALVASLAGMSKRGPAGHVGIRFLTMPDLAELLATAAMAEEGRSPLPDGAARVLWRRAVAETRDAFFEPIRGAHGFPDAMRSTIRDLKSAGLTPMVLAKRAQGSSPLAKKLIALAEVWRRVEDASAAAGFHDDLDLLRAAAEIAVEDPPALRRSAAFLYGFHELTRAERRLVTGFLQRAVAAAFVPWADDAGDDSPWAIAEPMRDFLQGTLELMPEETSSITPKPLVPFRVIAAPGDAREAVEIARAISTAPGRLHETGVLMRTPAVLATRIDGALEDAGIPRFLPGELPLGHLPPARALRLLLDARRDDLPRSAVMEMVTTSPMRFAHLLGDLQESAAPGVWDALTRDWGIVSGAEEWRTRVAAGVAELTRAVDRDRDGEVEDARPGAGERERRARALARFVERLLALVAAIPAEGKWSELSGGVRRAWTALFDFADAEIVTDTLDGIALLDLLGRDAATERFARGTFSEMVELIEDALGSARSPSDDFEGDGALVADLERARGLPFRTVILPGMVEGLFPRPPKSDPLLSDAERRHLNRALSAEAGFDEADEAIDEAPEDLGADGPLPLRAARAAEERFFFRVAQEAARDEIVFTLPRLDADTARERVPSFFLMQKVEKAIGAPHALTVPEFASAREWVRWMPLDPAPETRAVALTRLERDLFDLREALGSDLARVARLVTRTPFGRAALAAERGRWSEKRFTRWDGWLEGSGALQEALAALSLGAEISATRLERYANCPYQFFLHDGLGLAAIEEPERRLTLDPRDRGDLIHQALERFWRERRDAKKVPLEPSDIGEAQARLGDIASEILDAFEKNGITGPRVLWLAARQEILQDLSELLVLRGESDVDWKPVEFELGFGSAFPDRGGANPPVAVGAVPFSDSLSFRGRIDRVDLSTDGKSGRVVDYKTGRERVTFRAKRGEEFEPVFYGGKALQLPIYVLAAKLRFPEVTEWSAVYDHCTRRGKFSVPGISVDDATIAELKTLVERLAADASSGRFPFIASDACRVCDFADVCGPAHDVAFDAKAGSPEFAPFLERTEKFP